MANQGLMSPNTDTYGRVTNANQGVAPNASQGASAASQSPYGNPLTNPNIKTVAQEAENPTDPFESFIPYTDEYGRAAVGGGNRDQNVIVRGPKLTYDSGYFPGSGTGRNPINPDPNVGNLNPKGGGTIGTGGEVGGEGGAAPPILEPDLLGIPLSVIAGTLSVGVPLLQFMRHGTMSSGLTLMPWLENTIDDFGAAFLGFAPSADGISLAIAEAGGATEWLAANEGLIGQTSLGSAIGFGMFGGTIAGLLGLGHDNMFVDLAASAVGGAVGASLAAGTGTALLGQALGSWGGPVGAAIGGFVFTVIGGMFSKPPSDKLAGREWDPSTRSISNSWSFEGKKYSPENNKFVDDFFTTYGQFVSSLESLTGGKLDMGKVGFEVGNRDGAGLWVDGNRERYDTAGDAFMRLGSLTIQNMTGLNADATFVQKNMDYTQPFDTQLADIKFGTNFKSNIAAMTDGTINLDVEDSAEVYAIGQQFIANTQKLGLRVDEAEAAVANLYTLAGVDPAVEDEGYQKRFSGQQSGAAQGMDQFDAIWLQQYQQSQQST